MDKVAKQILSQLQESKSHSICFQGFDEPFQDFASQGQVKAAIEYLAKYEYIHVTYKDGSIYEVYSSYRSSHPLTYILKAIGSYFSKNWIAIAALVISIIALTQ